MSLKKVLFVLALTLGLSGCDLDANNNRREADRQAGFTPAKTLWRDQALNIYLFELGDGHDYIWAYSCNGGVALIHAAGCRKCTTTKEVGR